MRRLLALVLSAVFLIGFLPSAGAQPSAGVNRWEAEGVEAGRDLREGAREVRERLAAARSRVGEAPPPGEVPDPPAEENVNLPPGLVPYHEIAGRLRDLAARSDRVSVEVYGQSAGGRDLYLVTVADPAAGDLDADLAFRQLMVRDPERARQVAEANPGLRSPLWVHGSIHGNEWEGVDASLALIERLAIGDDPEARRILSEHILLFNVVANPDGRVLGTRRNASDIDLNRDFATRSQPETRAVVEQFVKWNPSAVYDLHGYVNPYLMEPTTAPHNPNYEYDLYIRHAYPAAKAGEANLAAEVGLPLDIPFEDYPRGDWDDWPPIFTPMYGMYHGAIGHTMETSLRQNGPALALPPEVREEQGRINTASHVAATWGAMGYMTDHAQEVTLDQIEVFRRGAAAEPPASAPFLEPETASALPSPPGYTANPPAAYVIPVGGVQRSEPAAVRLVNHLIANGIEVRRARVPFRSGGVLYPRGSYIVDMAQARRGLANTFLEPGYDLTPVSPQMYDISGWSLSELWGATVVSAEASLRRSGRLLREEVQVAVEVPAGAPAYALTLTDPSAIRATNALLDAGVALVRLPDGRVLVPGEAYADLVKAAGPEGLDVTVLDEVPEGGAALQPVRIAGAIALNEEVLLRELGFDVTFVGADELATLSAADYDVLAVSRGLTWEDLGADAQAAVQAFLAAGGGLVAWTETGAAFNAGAGVLPVTFAVPETEATPNGIGRVVHPTDSPITGGYPEVDSTFVYSPVWFPEVGAGVRVDERFADGDFFFAGHWIGQEAASGQPVVVSGTSASGARAVLFGSEPLFRHHPKGLFGQMAQALYWASGT